MLHVFDFVFVSGFVSTDVESLTWRYCGFLHLIRNRLALQIWKAEGEEKRILTRITFVLCQRRSVVQTPPKPRMGGDVDRVFLLLAVLQ
jgi:hypothetical protein